MVTSRGYVKKTSLNLFGNIRSSGIIALTISDDDDLVSVRITEGASDVLIGTRNGWAIRFREENVRPMGRTARGVRGIRLRGDDDFVVGMAVIPREETATLLTVCERGYGKRTPTSDYPTKNRGGKGVITIKTTERNGKVVSLRLVSDDDDLMLITDGGKLIRMPVDGIPPSANTWKSASSGWRGWKVMALERMAEKGRASRGGARGMAARAARQARPGGEDLGRRRWRQRGG
jgi:DNA gyrase subunit A